MLRGKFLRKFFIMAIIVIAIAAVLIHKENPAVPPRSAATVPLHLSKARRQHILYGDAHGGGHLHGAGMACKSEFPASWSADKVLKVVTTDAANDNLDWHHEKNGYDVADTMEDGIQIRIVVNGTHSEVITAYPLNTPRNPCTPAANDNGE